MLMPTLRRVRLTPLLAALMLSLSPPVPLALAQAVPTAPQTASVPANILPERTPIQVRLENELKSGSSKAGEEVPFTVVSDVYSPSHTLLITAGASAYGKVTRSSRRGVFGKAGKLDFTCEYVVAPDKTHVPLRAQPMGGSGRNNTSAMVATALLLAPIAILMNGRDVTIHKGQEFTMYVDKDTALHPFLPLTSAVAPASAPGKSLFLLQNGTQVTGSIVSFDGTTYTVATDQGTQTLKAAEVKSVYALAASPGAPAATATLAGK